MLAKLIPSRMDERESESEEKMNTKMAQFFIFPWDLAHENFYFVWKRKCNFCTWYVNMIDLIKHTIIASGLLQRVYFV